VDFAWIITGSGRCQPGGYGGRPRDQGARRETAPVDERSQVPPPVDVEVDREHGVTLIWSDGHTSRFALPDLRANCPCAWCRVRREAGEADWPASSGGAEGLRVEGAEFVGNWGVQLRWNDGHHTGIYSWALLRSWCRCQQCDEEA
jgi:DUF971 family protein